MKRCTHCHIDKNDSDFQKRYDREGLQSWCKACTATIGKGASGQAYRRRPEVRARKREYLRVYRAENLEKMQAYDRARIPLKVEYNRLDKNKIRQRAQRIVNHAVTSGKIPAPSTLSCGSFVNAASFIIQVVKSVCPKFAVHYHHYNGYAGENAFKVQALCMSCHSKTRELD